MQRVSSGKFAFVVALAGVLCACTSSGEKSIRSAKAAALPTDWRRVATPADAARLHDWRDAFVRALSSARSAGQGAAIAREGVLLVPDAALPVGALPEGRFRCRIIKLGARAAGQNAFMAYPPFDCRITDEGDVKSFAKLTGSQRPVGLIFDASPTRRVFLGTMMLGDEPRAMEYGRDAARDMVGAIERVGDKRWRLVLPYPAFESLLDVIELVPAT